MRCPSCISSAVIYDQLRGEYICTRCGLIVVERMPILKPEWRSKPGEEKIARAEMTSGLDIAQHDFGLGSKFDVYGEFSPKRRAELLRLRKVQQRSRARSYAERSLRDGLIEIDKLCERLMLPKSIRMEASALYRKAKAEKLTAGRATWSVLAALIFITCRRAGLPRTEREITKASKELSDLPESITLKQIRKSQKFFSKKLKLETPRTSPQDYLNRFADGLKLPRSAIEKAHEICSTLPKGLRSKPSTLLAASALYISAEGINLGVTLRKVSEVTGVSISSLSQTVTRIRKFRDGA